MKIGLITFHSAVNYGAVLQAYALQTTLTSAKNTVEIINYLPSYLPDSRKIYANLRIKRGDSLSKIFLKSALFALFVLNIRQHVHRARYYSEFLSKQMHISARSYLKYNELYERNFTSKDYDLYLVGSDQIWNPQITGGKLDPSLFLKFVNDPSITASYAASMGYGTLNETDTAEFKQLINSLGQISVRELSLLRYVQSNTDRRAELVVDPTLLLTKDDWEGISLAPTRKIRNYLLVYTACTAAKRFSSSLRPSRHHYIVVLTTDEIIQIITMTVDWHFPVSEVAALYHITPERVYQLRKSYQDTGLYPLPKKLGRPPVIPSPKIREIIISEKKKLGIGSRSLCAWLNTNRGIAIGERAIHRVLQEENLTVPNPLNSHTRPKWIRYERDNSLSAVHMDWHDSKYNGKKVCVVLDDASRMILAGGEFDQATAEISIQLLREAYQKYEYLSPIREVITDHGTQFYANTRDANGEASHSFEEFCKEMNITHILARVKHPQTNGKVEVWFGLYKRMRDKFSSFEEMIIWYNEIRPHRSLDAEKLLTPKEAFYRKAQGHIMKNCNELFQRHLGGNDETK